MQRSFLLLISVLAIGAALADESTLPEIDAKSYYLVDASSGAVLAESHATEQLDPASLTKLMTAYLTFDALVRGDVSLDDTVPVSEKAWRAPGSRMFIEVDTQVVLGDLLQGLIVQSGNDAAIALAEYIGGSEEAFVSQMNGQAAELGMTGTTYHNANGLPAKGHVSTARDTAVLARALIDNFPQYYSYYSEREFTYNDITQHNRNALLWRDDSVDGLKTGYTRAAGYCLAGSAERDGMRLVSVVFGASTADARTESSMALLDYGFDVFETHKLYSRGEAIAKARVFKGNQDMLEVGPAEDVFITVPRGEYSSLAASASLTTGLVAPLSENETVGELEIRFGDERISVLPLVALEAVKEGWFLTRIADSLALKFN
jgi:D-alanyl-D-alanine carboxypeptidase (penicillin-binding protein 5/6)